MLEETADNAEDADVFAQARDFRPQTADAAHDQVDRDLRARSFVKFLDDLLIDQRVQFRDDAGRFSGERVIALALDQTDQARLHVERRDHQFFQPGITGQAGQRVENAGHFVGQLRLGREKTEIGVSAGGARMIIAGAEMHVMTKPIGIAPDDQQRFAMRLQSDDAVDDVRAGFFEAAGPLNVGGFIEASAQFDDGGDLFPRVGRFDQELRRSANRRSFDKA